MARTPAIQLAPGVWRIPTIGRSAVNSYAFVNADGSVALIDCGFKRAPRRIVNGLAVIGKRPADVTTIILTHAHSDHAGGAAEMARRTQAAVLAHQADASYAKAGHVPGPDLSFLTGRIFNRLRSGKFPPVKIATPLSDGDVLDIAGGLRVIHTPGHSPGHVSLLHEPSQTLITGDAIFNVLGVRWPPKFFCSNFKMTQQTAHVLGELDYKIAAFTHGPQITDNPREQLRRFLRRTPIA